MTVTYKGFQGTVSDADMAVMFPHHAPCVLGPADLAVTAVAGARRVAVAAGGALASFLRYASDAVQNVDLAPPTSGGKWYAITLDRQWSPTNTVTLKADDLAVTNDGTVPVLPTAAVASAVAALPNQPGTAGSTAGQRQILALAHVRAADTTLTIFDMRAKRTGAGGLTVPNLAALSILGGRGLFLEGSVVSVGAYTMPSGARHAMSTWRLRDDGKFYPVGRIEVDETNLTVAAGADWYADANNSRRDVLDVALANYPVPLALVSQSELLDYRTGSVFRFGTPVTGFVGWRVWDTPWFDFAPSFLANVAGQVATSKVRMAAGVARWELQMNVSGGGGGQVQIGPLPFRRGFSYSAFPGGRSYAYYSNGQKVPLYWEWATAAAGEANLVASFLSPGSGIEGALTGTSPQNLVNGILSASLSWTPYVA